MNKSTVRRHDVGGVDQVDKSRSIQVVSRSPRAATQTETTVVQIGCAVNSASRQLSRTECSQGTNMARLIGIGIYVQGLRVFGFENIIKD